MGDPMERGKKLPRESCGVCGVNVCSRVNVVGEGSDR